jgi:hypothetical protein
MLTIFHYYLYLETSKVATKLNKRVNNTQEHEHDSPGSFWHRNGPRTDAW